MSRDPAHAIRMGELERRVLAQLDDHWQMARELRVPGYTQPQVIWTLQSLRRLGLVTYRPPVDNGLIRRIGEWASTEAGDAENERLGQ